MADEIVMSVVAIEPTQETDPGLQKWADQEACALLAFVAPYSGLRLNPVSEAYASIGVQEEFGIESFIEKCASIRVKKLHLLVNSPGGSVVSSYKVATALRSQFDQIRTFVPHMAASGGTLIALTGDEIVMGIMSHLSPLDPQAFYKGMWISSNSFMRCFERFKRQFAQLQADEAPYPVKCMTEKLDPLIMEEMCGTTTTCMRYVADVLEASGYEKSDALQKASWLTTNFIDHSTVLRRDILAEQGFRVVHETKYHKEWILLRKWLRAYIGRSESVHHMRYCLPKPAHKTTLMPEGVKDRQAAGQANDVANGKPAGAGDHKRGKDNGKATK